MTYLDLRNKRLGALGTKGLIKFLNENIGILVKEVTLGVEEIPSVECLVQVLRFVSLNIRWEGGFEGNCYHSEIIELFEEANVSLDRCPNYKDKLINELSLWAHSLVKSTRDFVKGKDRVLEGKLSFRIDEKVLPYFLLVLEKIQSVEANFVTGLFLLNYCTKKTPDKVVLSKKRGVAFLIEVVKAQNVEYSSIALNILQSIYEQPPVDGPSQHATSKPMNITPNRAGSTSNPMITPTQGLPPCSFLENEYEKQLQEIGLCSSPTNRFFVPLNKKFLGKLEEELSLQKVIRRSSFIEGSSEDDRESLRSVIKYEISEEGFGGRAGLQEKEPSTHLLRASEIKQEKNRSLVVAFLKPIRNAICDRVWPATLFTHSRPTRGLPVHSSLTNEEGKQRETYLFLNPQIVDNHEQGGYSPHATSKPINVKGFN